ncbi:MAG: DNA/RNA non-specific endonuclease [Prevotella sp.]|nr:DNA/RNA non-specific endonuclease [Prevotella sp.]
MMKHLKLFFYLISFSLAFTACGGDDDDTGGGGNNGGKSGGDTEVNVNANDPSKHNSLAAPYINNLEFPHVKDGSSNYIIIHLAQGIGLNNSTEWDFTKHSQRWTCFSWHAGNSDSSTKRKPNEKTSEDFSEYPNDPALPSQYHFTVDPYRSSGFDHGHIMASADRSYAYNETANRQTFYMTNMQPQNGDFNVGVWQNMENQARKWNNSNFREVLYVCKGGTIDSEDNLGGPNSYGDVKKYIGSGENKIPVPGYFYMAFLCKKPQSQGGGYEAAAFWVEHKVSADNKLLKYLISIDELEQKTGIDFFCNLPDKTEELVEKTVGSSFKVGLK